MRHNTPAAGAKAPESSVRGSNRHSGEILTATRSVGFFAPLPPRVLHPNSREHWARKATATRQYRLSVGLCLLEACGGRSGVPRFERATVDLDYMFTTDRPRDIDNLIAWFKAGLDGIRDTQIVPNDDAAHIRIGDVTTGKGRRAQVAVTITERA